MSINLRNEIVMEVQLAEKSFRAHFPGGVSYQECFDALSQFANKILEMSKAYEAAQAPAEQPAETTQTASHATSDCPIAPMCPENCTGQASA